MRYNVALTFPVDWVTMVSDNHRKAFNRAFLGARGPRSGPALASSVDVQPFQRALDVAHRVDGDAGVQGFVSNLAVAEFSN
jgi:hypothetical protein